MTLQEAENEKIRILKFLANKKLEHNIVVHIAPSNNQDFEAFERLRRNSLTAVALATFAMFDMMVYIEDNRQDRSETYETIEQFCLRCNLPQLRIL